MIYIIIGTFLLASLACYITKNYKFSTLAAFLIGGLLSVYNYFIWNSYNEGMLGFFGTFFIFIGLLIMIDSFGRIEEWIGYDKTPTFYSIVLLLFGSIFGIIYFDNLILIYVFLELSAFLSAGLIIIRNSKYARGGGLKYLFLSLVASVFFLISIVIFYRLTGTLNLSQMRGLITDFNNNLLSIALIFVLIGLGLKSALFPFHIWLRDAYGNAIPYSSAILSGLISKSYILLFIKILYIGIGIDIVREYNILTISLILGSIGMIYGSVMAMLQDEIYLRVSYSSVAQIGYIYMGLGLGNELGLMAALFHILAHGIAKPALFLSTGKIIQRTKLKKPENMNGIGKIMPNTLLIYSLATLSMIGIPLFVGFISKWNFARGIMSNGGVYLIIVLTLSSLLNGIYFMPLIIRGYLIENKKLENIKEKISIAFNILGVLLLVFGIFSQPIINILQRIISSI